MTFKPEAFLLGTSTRPSSVVLYGITGGSDRWLRISLDVSKPPITFVSQALSVVRKTPKVPFFGDTTGFVINYAADRAVRFDIHGDPQEVLCEPYSPGPVNVSIAGRQMPEKIIWRR
jgi:hypothetical protein